MPTSTTTEHIRIASRDTFAKARAEKNVSLKQVSEKTRIPERYLTLFEGKGTIPRDVYTTIYLKAYCKFLGVEYNHMVEKVVSTSEQTEPIQQSKERKHPKPSLRLYETLPLAALGRKMVFFLLALGIAGYVGYELYAMVIPPKLTLTTPQENTIINDPNLTIQGIAAPEVTVTVNGKVIPVDNKGEFIDHIDLAIGHNTITVTAKKKYGKPTTIERNIIVTPQNN